MATSPCLRVLLLLTFSVVLTVTKCSQSDQVEVTSCGVGFELIQHRFDALQYKFLELSVNVMEYGEAVQNKQRSIEEQIFRLETSVAANLSLVTNYSRQVLDLQTICSNHDRIRNELRKLQPKKSALEKLDSPNSCSEGSDSGEISLDILNISNPVDVFCDMKTFGGRWLVVQQRVDNTVSFNRNWIEYRDGFGQPTSNFWIGLEKLHQLTTHDSYELFVELQFANGSLGIAHYSEFRVGSEDEKYALVKLGRFSGTAVDALRQHKGCSFSTYDNYNVGGKNWAGADQGGWWYYGSYTSQLNSGFGSSYGIYWNESHLKFASMKIRKKL
uniref:Ficolin-3 n=2 Tax=Culex pipiens TaxID=7175 RepID=A0A8D8G1H5_CULPI